jgi:hypothetical protein
MRYISIFGVQSQLPFFVYELRGLLGISEPVMVPRINASKRNKYFARLSNLDRQKLVDIIADNNQAEIEVYNQIEHQVHSRISQFINK